jgi:hypothetical protein
MFVVSPKIGLCNQIQSIVKTFLLGIKYNRQIYIDNFQIDLNSGRLIDINEILDIDKMNNFYCENNINIKIHKYIDNNIIKELSGIDYNKIPTMSFINDFIDNNINEKCIYLGNPVSLDITKSFGYAWNDLTNLYYFLITNLFFKQIFYHVKDNIKNELKLTNYITCHLRIEDDAIKHFSHCYHLTLDEYNKKLLDYYENKINNEYKYIYICSGILDNSNSINLNYYNKLLQDNDKICDKRNIIIPEMIKNNRELIAIVDLLIAFDSEEFMGCWISSFSQIINVYFKNKGKKTDLFHL